MRKNLPYIKFQMFEVFFKSPGPVRKHLHFNLIKMHQNYFFSPKKPLIFTLLNLKILIELKLSRNTTKLWSIEMLMISLKIISQKNMSLKSVRL